MKRLFVGILFGVPSPTNGSTLRSIAISPQDAALQSGSTQQFTVVCTYSDGTTGNCTKAGGATWSSSRSTARAGYCSELRMPNTASRRS
ncbi:MAG: hypothetical protein ACYDC6_02555 [Acidobacteriaceae bacterium]